jgi:hypothetical protein
LKRRESYTSIGLVFLVALIAMFGAVPVSASADPSNPPTSSDESSPANEQDDSDEDALDAPREDDDQDSEKDRPGKEGSKEKDLDDSAPGEDPDEGDGGKTEEAKGNKEGHGNNRGRGGECGGHDDSDDDNKGTCQKPKAGSQSPSSVDSGSPTTGTVAGTSGQVEASADAWSTPGEGGGADLKSAGSTTRTISRVVKNRRILSGGGQLLGGAQPSLTIVVNALNDADGDGIYSDSEIAPAPGVDISFKAVISNNGVTPFEIVSVSHAFTEPSGRVQVEVCGDLAGLTVASGEFFACPFSVPDYSPPLGESVVNSVSASAIEVGGSGRRGTSDSDNSTVATLLGDEVLASVVQRVPGPLAFTGTNAARLVALALVLLAAGGGLIVLARVRGGRPGDPVLRTGPWIRLPGWRSTTSVKPRPLHKTSRS